MAGMIVLLHCFNPQYQVSEVASEVNGGQILDINGIIQVFFSQGVCRAAVPVFFLISGYLFFTNLQEWNSVILKSKIKKRVFSLLFPYLLWNVIAFVAYYLVQCFKAHGLIAIFDCFLEKGGLRIFWDSHSGWMPFDFPLWYIRDLIAVVIISPVIWAIVKNKVLGMTLMGIVGVCHLTCLWPITNGLSSVAVLFFMAGAYLQIHNYDLLRAFKRIELPSYLLSIFLLALITFCWARYDLNQYLHHVLQISITIATLNIALRLSNSKVESLGCKLSKTSFWIFAIQSIYVIAVSKIAMSHIFAYQYPVVETVRYFGSFIIALSICIISFYVFNKCFPRSMKVLGCSR